MFRAVFALALGLGLAPARAEHAAPAVAPAVAPPDAPPAPLKLEDDITPDMWIFSGILPGNHEPYSGTLVSGKADTQFEMKLAGDTTCDSSELKGGVGLVRLSEIACSDGRSMRALFVPQGGQSLKVFGHVGDERFVSAAHLLGTEPVPEQKQTAEPTVPQVLPTPPRPDPHP